MDFSLFKLSSLSSLFFYCLYSYTTSFVLSKIPIWEFIFYPKFNGFHPTSKVRNKSRFTKAKKYWKCSLCVCQLKSMRITIQEFTLANKSDRVKGMRIWHAVRGEGSESGIWPRPREAASQPDFEFSEKKQKKIDKMPVFGKYPRLSTVLN